MNILVVDSGIKLSHEAFEEFNIESYEIVGNRLEQVFCDNDENGHGTAVCGLICNSLKRYGVDANVKMLKAFSGDSVNESGIVNALMLADEFFDVDIINMSFGIRDSKCNSIVKACNFLLKKAIIVSAVDNLGTLSVPSVIPGVIGVISDKTVTKSHQYNYYKGLPIQMGAYGKLQRVAWNNPDFIFLEGNSMACANATGIVANLVWQYGKDSLQEQLLLNSFKEPVCFQTREKYSLEIPFSIKKAAIFPLNKETGSLLLFKDMLGFDIVDVYDSPISGKVGSNASQIMNLNLDCDFKVKNINDFSSDEVDTLIVGHITEYLKYPRERDRIFSMLENCKKDLHYYFFDPVENNENVFSPVLDESYIPPTFGDGMLYGIHTPILGIFGTSSSQGKFTLQLYLRKIFSTIGYSVGQIGTEPESLLFDFDAIYSMGYNSSVDFSDKDMILYLNKVIHEIEMNNEYDLIITGSQSGTVPYSFGSISNMTLKQSAFLFATCPDVVVLSVNVFDDKEYIERTIKFIESSADTKVVAIVIFPKVRKAASKMFGEKDDIENINMKCKEINEYFNIPVFVLGQKMNELCDVIIDYLSN